MTLQEILDNVLLESGMGTETAYATNSDDAVKRLVALANRSADYLSSCHPWQALRKTYSFTLSTDTQYPLPTDFRELIPDTTYADSYYDPVDMRTDPGVWRYIKTNGISTGPRYRMRILGGLIEVNEPNSGDSISFEYLSNQAVADSGGTRKQRFTADTDTFVLDDDLLTADTLWRHARLVGLPQWQDLRGEAIKLKVEREGAEAGSKMLIGGEYAEPGGHPYTPLWVNNA